MKSLIVNADDFGLTAGVNDGIIQAFREGIVTSTTLMANGDAFDDAIEKARQIPGLDVGCHLVLTGGRPIAPPEKIPSLVTKNGYLPKSLVDVVTRVSAGFIRRQDIETEFRAQIDKIREAGIVPSHVDTHKHTHVHPKIMEAFFDAAFACGILRVRKPFERLPGGTHKSNGRRAHAHANDSNHGNHASHSGEKPLPPIGPLPKGDKLQRLLASLSGVSAPLFRRGLRAHELKAPDYFLGIAVTGHMDAAVLQQMIENLPDGSSELMCHPGTHDAQLEATGTRLTKSREIELSALIDPGVRAAIRAAGVQLIPYRDLN